MAGKQYWAREGLLRPAPAMPLEPARPLSAEAPLHRRPKTSFWELHSAKGNTPPAANHSPNAPRIQRATQAVFAPGPTLSIGQSRAELTLAPWTLLLCWVSPAEDTHSPRVLLRWEAGLGGRWPHAHSSQPCPLSQLGGTALRSSRTFGPKRASGSCILQRETLLEQQTTAPTRVGSRKQRKPFSPPPHPLHRAKRGWTAPGSLGPAALLGVSAAETHSPRVFLRGEAGWAGEGLLRRVPSHAT